MNYKQVIFLLIIHDTVLVIRSSVHLLPKNVLHNRNWTVITISLLLTYHSYVNYNHMMTRKLKKIAAMKHRFLDIYREGLHLLVWLVSSKSYVWLSKTLGFHCKRYRIFVDTLLYDSHLNPNQHNQQTAGYLSSVLSVYRQGLVNCQMAQWPTHSWLLLHILPQPCQAALMPT